MNDATLIKTGAIGAVTAAVCCATPVLGLLGRGVCQRRMGR
jgi:hypothetical protein